MKIRTLSETQLQRSSDRFIDLQLRGYSFRIKRRGKVVAKLEPIRPTIFSRRNGKKH